MLFLTLTMSTFSLGGPYGDFRDDLTANGYVVVKNAIPPQRAKQYQQEAFEWPVSQLSRSKRDCGERMDGCLLVRIGNQNWGLRTGG